MQVVFKIAEHIFDTVKQPVNLPAIYCFITFMIIDSASINPVLQAHPATPIMYLNKSF